MSNGIFYTNEEIKEIDDHAEMLSGMINELKAENENMLKVLDLISKTDTCEQSGFIEKCEMCPAMKLQDCANAIAIKCLKELL